MSILDVLKPKSDQINADDLIGRTMTVTIKEILVKAGDQPISIFFEGDYEKPYKPCKSMGRVMAHIWTDDEKKWIGKSMTLYCDPKVTFGPVAMGGIRISHMSDIAAPVTLMLTVTKASRKPFTVQPLKVQAPAAPAEDDKSTDIARKLIGRIAAADICHATLEKGDSGKTLAQRTADLKAAFEALGVTIPQLETKRGRKIEQFIAEDIASLGVIYKSLKHGEITLDEEFPRDVAKAPAGSKLDDLEAQVAKAAPQVDPPASEPDQPHDLDAAFVENLINEFQRAKDAKALSATRTKAAMDRIDKLSEDSVAQVKMAYEQREADFAARVDG